MSTEKRPPTADEIAKLIKQSWNSAGSQYPIVEKLRDALEAQADQLKQAREIIWMNHGHIELYGDDGEMQCRSFDFKRATWIEIWDHLDPAGAPIRAAIVANPASTTESEHGND